MPAASSKGYVSLPCRVADRAFLSTLFLREHVSRADDADLPSGRTLFVLNVPSGVQAGALAAAFEARVGDVASTNLGEGEDGSRTAHIVFAKPAGLKKAVGLASKPKPLELRAEGGAKGGGLRATGSSAMPTRAALQEAVGEFMQNFESQEAARREEEEARHNQMDSDGFVVVTRKRTGRSTTTDGSGATVSVATAGMERHIAEQTGDDADGADGGGGVRGRKKKKPKEMVDFYHFQQHEKKREGLMKLREQFEADKERIAKMRADRKFKPQGY